MLQDHFTGNKASGINKNLFWYFYWNYVCFFASKFKATETLEATVSKETVGFDIWMATI